VEITYIKTAIRNGSLVCAGVVTALGIASIISAQGDLPRYLAMAVTASGPLCAFFLNWHVGSRLQASERAGSLQIEQVSSEQPVQQNQIQKADEQELEKKNQKTIQRTAFVEDFQEAPQVDPKVAVCQLLTILQKEGRFVDFLQEDIEQFEDAQIGAAARQVHSGCREALKGYLGILPVIDAPEGSEVEVDSDFDPAKIKLVGKIKGKPPYRGIVLHPGWRFSRITLPDIANQKTNEVITPAEVEIA